MLNIDHPAAHKMRIGRSSNRAQKRQRRVGLSCRTRFL